MSDATDNPNEDAAAEESQGPVGGERLAAARREQQISVLEIAKELHLDEPKVRALENNEFDMLGAPVFAKGHLKKYAQLVGVDEGDVLADYYQLNRAASAPPLVSARPRPRREMSPGPWIVLVVIIIAVATAYWWFTTRPLNVSTPPDEAPQEQAPADEAEEPLADIVPDEPQITAPTADEAVETSVAEPAADNVAATSDEAVAETANELRLRLSYSGECWTEITDASGRRLFFDLGRAGRTVELSGEAPFNVLFGNAENVSLQVNGSDYDLSTAARRGRTVRLTIAGT